MNVQKDTATGHLVYIKLGLENGFRHPKQSWSGTLAFPMEEMAQNVGGDQERVVTGNQHLTVCYRPGQTT